MTPLHAVPSPAMISRYKNSWAPKSAGHVPPATPSSIAAGNAPGVYDFKAAEEARQRAADSARRDAYRRFLYRLVEENLKDPQFRRQADVMFMDGTSLHTIFTCLVTKKGKEKNNEPRAPKRCRVKPVLDDKGRVVWDGRLSDEQWQALEKQRELAFKRYWTVTADGGFLAYKSGRNRSGHGYTAVTLIDQGGLPLDFAVGRINQSERLHAVRLLDSFADNVRPLLDAGGREEKPRVIAADSGFTGHRIRNRIRNLGAIENISPATRSKRKRSQEQVRKRDERRYPIIDPKKSTQTNWYTDGHRTLHCVCGQGQTANRFYFRQDGRLVPRVLGECENCGSISISSDQWRLRAGCGGSATRRTRATCPTC